MVDLEYSKPGDTQKVMNTAVDPNLRKRNLRTIGALAAVFLLPLVASFYMYYGSGWRPAASTAHGELYQPARPLPKADLRDPKGEFAPANVLNEKWALVYVGGGQCDDACKTSLHFMRQTRLSLNNEMTRVARVFLATSQCCDQAFLDREHAGLVTLDASGPDAADLVATFPVQDREHSLYVVDPLGNLVMRYDTRDTPKGMLTDLKKLLKLSHIG
jgi:cytochrome oxidase Cu insertion factor (SCO1/SenC/PrrC family)